MDDFANPLIADAICYTDTALIISVPTRTPAVTHEGLMIAVAAAVKAYMSNPDVSPADARKMIFLLQFLEALIPKEKELLLAYAS